MQIQISVYTKKFAICLVWFHNIWCNIGGDYISMTQLGYSSTVPQKWWWGTMLELIQNFSQLAVSSGGSREFLNLWRVGKPKLVSYSISANSVYRNQLSVWRYNDQLYWEVVLFVRKVGEENSLPLVTTTILACRCHHHWTKPSSYLAELESQSLTASCQNLWRNKRWRKNSPKDVAEKKNKPTNKGINSYLWKWVR